MNKKLSHVVQAVYGTPWFVLPSTLRTIAEVVRLHVDGDRLTPAEVRERLDAAAAATGPRRGGQIVSSVGVIPVYGVIMPRATLMTEYSGGATVQGITRSFRELLEDESVGSILFDIDSPGGYTDGVEELASEIRAARGRKPIAAIADYTMASAAYYLGCQADEVIASPSALVGSIGCLIVHTEYSKMDEQLGITSTIIRRPPAKAESNEIEPLSDAARAALEERVGDYYGQFVDAVAKARGVTAAQVRAGYGEGRVLTAARAKSAGLVDRVDTFDNTIRRLATGKGPVSRGTSARIEHFDGQGQPITAEEAIAALAAGDAEPIDEPETTPARSDEAQAAVAIARAKANR
jgi:signal peptide peptidase SppA